MKRLFYPLLAITLLFTACEGPAGKDGAIGPQGAKGETGAIGPQGPTGAAGQDFAKPRFYDFKLAFKPLPVKVFQAYNLAQPIGEDEFIFVYLFSGKDHIILPYEGIVETADGSSRQSVKLEYRYRTTERSIFLSNESAMTYTQPQEFKFRAVIIKGAFGARMNLERYNDYNNLKSDYNLPD